MIFNGRQKALAFRISSGSMNISSRFRCLEELHLMPQKTLSLPTSANKGEKTGAFQLPNYEVMNGHMNKGSKL
uniref:Uncharacterized protein n=1 Tax=Romanomermis culicivorax TaxID=13658 RepID=A0A915KSI8_ROMCU